MLSTLLVWGYIAPLTAVYGLIAVYFLARILRLPDSEPPPLALVCLAGLMTLSALLSALSLVISISVLAHLIVLILAGAFLVAQRVAVRGTLAAWLESIRSTHPGALVLTLLAIVFVLGRAAQFPEHGDVGLYHAQAVRWLEEYGTVAGLGNLHSRLAFNSSWHLPTAFFSMSFLGPQPFRALNGFLFLLAAIMFIQCGARLLRGSQLTSDLVGACLFVPALFFYRDHLSHSANDMPVALLVWIVVLLFLQRAEERLEHKLDIQSALVVLIGVFAVMIKLAALPILALPAWILVRAWLTGQRERLLLVAGCALVLLIPWLARGVWLSGHLVYPLSSLPAPPVDWQMPPQQAEAESREIQAWARLPRRPTNEVLALSLSEWTPVWWRGLADVPRAMLVAIGLASLAYLAAAAVFHRRAARLLHDNPGPIIGALVGYLGVAFWFFTAPDVRFGLGFIVILLLLLWAPPLYRLLDLLGQSPAHPRLAPAIIGLGLIVYQLALMPQSLTRSVVTRRLWLPPDYPSVQTNTVEVQNLRVRVPTSGNQCWNAPLPCTPQVNALLEARGRNPWDGFRSSRQGDAPAASGPADQRW